MKNCKSNKKHLMKRIIQKSDLIKFLFDFLMLSGNYYGRPYGYYY